MARDIELERLRKEAQLARRNASAKARRLRARDIVVAGTEHDPRRAPGIQNSYNKKQLRAYISQLKGFNNRSTQFVAGAAGRAIAKATYSQLQQAARMSNFRARDRMSLVAGVKMPGSDETYLEARQITKQRQGIVPGGTYDVVDFRADQIVSDSAARELTRMIESKSTPAGRARMNRTGAANVERMLSESSSPFLAQRWNTLTPNQQEILLNTPQFWEEAKFIKYEELQNGESDESETAISDLFNFAIRAAPAK